MARRDGVWSVGAEQFAGLRSSGIAVGVDDTPRNVELLFDSEWFFEWLPMDDGKIPAVVEVIANARTSVMSAIIEHRCVLKAEEYEVERVMSTQMQGGVLRIPRLDLTPYNGQDPWMLVYLSAYVEHKGKLRGPTTRVYMQTRRALTL